jgi:hypothetical protein
MKIFIIPVFLFISIFAYSDYTRQQAVDIVATEVVGIDQLQYHYLYSNLTTYLLNDTLWLDSYFDHLICPLNESWVFFIDDAPLANWAHPCRYVWFDKNSGEYIVLDYEWPPLNYLDGYPGFWFNWEWILSITSTQESISQSDIEIYPNPCSDYLFIETPIQIEDCQFYITNIAGWKVKSFNETVKSENKLRISISGLDDGIYFITILDAKGSMILRKFVVSN